MPGMALALQLQERWQVIEDRLVAVEAAADLYCRFAAIAARLDIVERALASQVRVPCKKPGAHSDEPPAMGLSDLRDTVQFCPEAP